MTCSPQDSLTLRGPTERCVSSPRSKTSTLHKHFILGCLSDHESADGWHGKVSTTATFHTCFFVHERNAPFRAFAPCTRYDGGCFPDLCKPIAMKKPIMPGKNRWMLLENERTDMSQGWEMQFPFTHYLWVSQADICQHTNIWLQSLKT